MNKLTNGEKAYRVFNYIALTLVGLLCLLPMINILAISFSTNAAVTANRVTFWPVDFTVRSYEYVLKKSEFWRAMMISFERVALGLIINTFFTVTVAYPLSKEPKQFRSRPFFVWYFVFTILFSGGLIPWYMTIRMTGLIGKIWALILPGAVPVFNVLVLMNFFRGIPKELEESAIIDGAGTWRVLVSIYLPLSVASLATVTLFTLVGHWNSWFDGLILMNRPRDYPLSSYLQTVIAKVDYSYMTKEQIQQMSELNDRTLRAAQIFLGALPILCAYPFLQRYFMTGLVLGSLKE